MDLSVRAERIGSCTRKCHRGPYTSPVNDVNMKASTVEIRYSFGRLSEYAFALGVLVRPQKGGPSVTRGRASCLMADVNPPLIWAPFGICRLRARCACAHKRAAPSVTRGRPLLVMAEAAPPSLGAAPVGYCCFVSPAVARLPGGFAKAGWRRAGTPAGRRRWP